MATTDEYKKYGVDESFSNIIDRAKEDFKSFHFNLITDEETREDIIVDAEIGFPKELINLSYEEALEGYISSRVWEEVVFREGPIEYVKSYDTTKSKGKEFLEKYVDSFTKISLMNNVYAHLTFHLIMGQIVGKDFKIRVSPESVLDGRVQVFISQSSGSGKTVPIKFIKRILDSLNINSKMPLGEITEPALVGSHIDQRIKLHDGSFESIRRDANDGIYRELEDGGVLILDEVGLFMKHSGKEYNAGILGYIQSASNEYHEPNFIVTRILRGVTIERKPYVSQLLLTFPIDEKIIELLKQGFFQRFLSDFRVLTKEEWKNLQKKYLDMAYDSMESIWEQSLKNKSYSEDLKFVIESFDNAREFSKGRIMTIDKSTKYLAEKFGEELNERIDVLNKYIQENLDTFRLRSYNYLFKLAAHRAVIDGRSVIDSNDINYAAKLLKHLLFSLIDRVESLKEVAKEQDSYTIRWRDFQRDKIDILKTIKNKNMKTSEFKELIVDYFAISDSSAKRILNNWAKKKLIKYIPGAGGNEGEVYI